MFTTAPNPQPQKNTKKKKKKKKKRQMAVGNFKEPGSSQQVHMESAE
jgi:hypothetical protein